jgi:hypothetical protein
MAAKGPTIDVRAGTASDQAHRPHHGDAGGELGPRPANYRAVVVVAGAELDVDVGVEGLL